MVCVHYIHSDLNMAKVLTDFLRFSQAVDATGCKTYITFMCVCVCVYVCVCVCVCAHICTSVCV